MWTVGINWAQWKEKRAKRRVEGSKKGWCKVQGWKTKHFNLSSCLATCSIAQLLKKWQNGHKERQLRLSGQSRSGDVSVCILATSFHTTITMGNASSP